MNPITGIIIISAVIITLIIIVALVWRNKKTSSQSHKTSVEQTALLISMPKEQLLSDRGEWNMDKTREAVALMESFLNSIAGLKVNNTTKNLVKGRQDHVSFEIVARQKEIWFYLFSPPNLVDYLKQSLLAVFPNAHIEEKEEYNIFQPRGYTEVANIRFTRDNSLPINTYLSLESDPLNNLTNALAKLDENEGTTIQFIARSTKSGWHKTAAKIAKEMQRGGTFPQAVKEARQNSVIKLLASINKTFRTPKQDELDKLEERQNRQLSPQEQEMVKGIEEKTTKGGLDVNIRIIVSTQSAARSEAIITNVSNSFNQFNLYEYGNKFEIIRPKNKNAFIERFILRKFSKPCLLLNTEELASIFHFPLPNTETPNIHWLKAKKAPAPINLPTEGILLGKNIYRGQETPVRISLSDRRRHLYIIGMTGVGKSVFMHEMARQDIQAGHGLCIIDPHGDLAEGLLNVVPSNRVKDVIYFNPADIERPIGLNMLEASGIHEQDFAIQEMIMIFYKLVSDPSMIGPMFEHNMRNAMLTLMADPKESGTISEIPRIFSDPVFQKDRLKNVTDPMVRAFWEKEMAKTSDFHKSEMLGYLISKVGRFVENTMMRNIIGQTKSGFDFKDVMNQRKILIINLSKGQIGEMNSNLLGLILVSKLQMAAMSRADLPEAERQDFFLYIDEFQNYTTDSIATILSEARKYRLDLIMAHQYLGQLSENNDTKIRDAVLGNVGTMVSFRIGVEDTETMARQFEPTFNEYDLVNVDKYNAFVRTLVDNAVTKPFNIETYQPDMGDPSQAKIIKEHSRLTYGRDRAEVEQEILKRSQLGSEVAPKTENTHGDTR